MKSHQPVSIVVPSYNSKKTIIQCLNSVLNQSYRNVEEVIVVDSSNDGTDDQIRQLFPSVKLIHLSKKTLPGAARNIGVRAARSEYIAFTDMDCIVDYYWIEKMMHVMTSSNYEAVGGAVINGTPESLSGTLGYLNEFNFHLHKKSGFVDCIATANVCYRRCVFDKLQFIETHFAGEDTIFHWSILKNGGNLFHDPDIKVIHLNRTGLINVLKHQRKMGEGAGLSRIIMKRDLILVKYPIFSILLLPWVRILKMYRRIFLNDKNLLINVTPFFPLSVIIAHSWSLGFFESLQKYKKNF